MSAEVSLNKLSIPAALVFTFFVTFAGVAYTGYVSDEEGQDAEIKELQIQAAENQATFSGQMTEVSKSLEKLARYHERHADDVSDLENRVQRLEIITEN